jgi:hypothetical protein
LARSDEQPWKVLAVGLHISNLRMFRISLPILTSCTCPQDNTCFYQQGGKLSMELHDDETRTNMSIWILKTLNALVDMTLATEVLVSQIVVCRTPSGSLASPHPRSCSTSPWTSVLLRIHNTMYSQHIVEIHNNLLRMHWHHFLSLVISCRRHKTNNLMKHHSARRCAGGSQVTVGRNITQRSVRINIYGLQSDFKSFRSTQLFDCMIKYWNMVYSQILNRVW